MTTTKFAAVTGAGSGIGRACALALLNDGWSVALLGRRADALNETARLAGRAAMEPFEGITDSDMLDVGARAERETLSRALPVTCDVGQEDQVIAAFATIEKTFGRLDLLFNNAGMGLPPATPDLVSGADWRRVVDANLNGSFYCLAQAFRIMKAQRPMGGRIINNGSISAYAPRPGSIAYTATKHAVSGLTRTAALDGRPYDIAVGQIDIGNAASEMTERMTAGVPQADGSVRPEPRMDLSAVVEAFMTMARLPLSANMLFVNVMATKMPFVGRG